MKKVLFLAPNYRYIRTTVTGITKDLIRRNIKFTTNVIPYPEARDRGKDDHATNDELYLKTNNIEVIFNLNDPIDWNIGMLYNVNVVYGKKELVELLHKKFPRANLRVEGTSVQRYIVENSIDENVDLMIDHTPIKTAYIPKIANVYFNNPMTVVIWSDGTKTLIKCQDGDEYSPEVGLAMCIAKKALGNKGNFNNVFKKWIPEVKDEVAIESAVESLKRMAYMSSMASDVMSKFKEALHKSREENTNG